MGADIEGALVLVGAVGVAGGHVVGLDVPAVGVDDEPQPVPGQVADLGHIVGVQDLGPPVLQPVDQVGPVLGPGVPDPGGEPGGNLAQNEVSFYYKREPRSKFG